MVYQYNVRLYQLKINELLLSTLKTECLINKAKEEYI